MSSSILVQCAKDLVAKVASDSKSQYGLSSMAPSIYDTAWLAMVEKKKDEGYEWVFPTSFEYLLREQTDDGGWDPLEGVTKRHTIHFTVELIVPVLLHLLSEEGVGFEFPAKEDLLSKYAAATSIDISWLYQGPCSIPLFSLEGFVRQLEWNKLGSLVTSAGITASPASAAAYLIYSPTWSDECEAYLRHIVSQGQGKGNGGAGGVYPLEVFEPCWVLSTLLESGFTVDNLGTENVGDLIELIHRSMPHGVAGATNTFLPDADDTARALMVLNNNGYEVSHANLIKNFEGEDCFETFDDRMPQRVTSVSVNGNVLNCLLSSPDPSAYTPQIEKIAKFMCTKWSKEKMLNDHWNFSEYHGIMHMAQSLVPVRVLWDQGCLPGLTEDIIQDRIPQYLQEVLNRVICGQNDDGSWGNMHGAEETAYAIIALAQLASHAAIASDYSKADLAIAKGKQFLLETWTMGQKPDRIWTGKVMHGISYVHDAHVLAALKINRANLAGKRGFF
ncbi:ent-kaurene synthase [Aspergillus piperis CBS 112811]|uniref:Ent-kaurene synthase n=1 Tax=Aspergillus piperis CBS 112811 TaxID=1448313 RepID=A0A8G1VM27_9EURO|nr:ent-kaurene synthase [Aspergillus piperis CBS 112811]RAH55298.1 ent-kaurene synthase [Aspergillus piperis CBS 112811]